MGDVISRVVILGLSQQYYTLSRRRSRVRVSSAPHLKAFIQFVLRLFSFSDFSIIPLTVYGVCMDFVWSKSTLRIDLLVDWFNWLVNITTKDRLIKITCPVFSDCHSMKKPKRRIQGRWVPYKNLSGSFNLLTITNLIFWIQVLIK